MNNLHSSSSFRSACVVQPRHPKTKLPTTAIERKSFDFSPLSNGNTSSPHSDETSNFSGNENTTSSKRKTKSSATNRNKSVNSNKRPLSKKKHTSKSVTVGYQPQCINVNNTTNSSLFDSKRLLEMKGLSVDDDLFFRHLQALKEENKRALNTLERLYKFGSGNEPTSIPPPANQQFRTKKVSRGGNSDEGITSDSNASRNSSENGSNDGYNNEDYSSVRESERNMPAESVQGSYIYGFNGNGLLKVADTRGSVNNGFNNGSQRHQNGGRAPSTIEHNVTFEETYDNHKSGMGNGFSNGKPDKQESDSDRENLDLENEYSDCNEENEEFEEIEDGNGSHYELIESEHEPIGNSEVSDQDNANRTNGNGHVIEKGYTLNNSNGHPRNGYDRPQQKRNSVLRNHSFAGMSRNTSSGYFSAHRMANRADNVSDMEKNAREERERIQKRIQSESSEDELDEKLKVRPPPNHVNILPEDERGPFRGRESNYDVIANMWNNFSVNDTVPAYTRNGTGRRSLRKSRSPGWSPGVTIQEPFKMTLREEKMKEAKEKKIARIKDELLQKQLEEEAELKKRVAPVPVPPSTFLPIYSEKQQIEHQKKQNMKQTSKELLKSIEKPFSFLEREEAKNKLKRSKSMNAKIDSSKTQFKANPYPDKLFDLTWKDKEAEQAEYRKIKIKLRSQELLAQSSLPPSMATRGDIKYYRKTKNNNSTNNKKNTNNNTANSKKKDKKKPKNFQPEVRHGIPDFQEMQKKIELALEARKNQNTPTICEPFNLHTAQIPSRRTKFNDSVDKSPISLKTTPPRRPSSSFTRSNTINYKNEHRQRPGSALTRSRSTSAQCGPQNGRFSRSRSISPVYSVTETARRRQELIRQSVEKEKLQQEKKIEEKKQKRKERQKLQKVVAQKTAAHDPSRFREKQTAEKLASFKRAERERTREYKEFLRSVEQKNEQRPLLFERESQTNAKRQAQKRYEEILRRAGIDGKTLEAFIAGDRELERRLAESRAEESDNDSDEENAAESDEENDISDEEDVGDVSEPEEDIPLKSDGMGYDVVLKSNNNSRSYDNRSDDEEEVAEDLNNDDNEDEYSDDAPVDGDSDEESYGEQDDDEVLNDDDNESDDGSYKP